MEYFVSSKYYCHVYVINKNKYIIMVTGKFAESGITFKSNYVTLITIENIQIY